MKKILSLLAFLLLTSTLTFAQSSRASKDKDVAYNGKVYDSYGQPLDKKKQNKRREKTSEVFDGEITKKSYPIGIDKDKRKKKSNYKGKKRKKGCNCPGH